MVLLANRAAPEMSKTSAVLCRMASYTTSSAIGQSGARSPRRRTARQRCEHHRIAVHDAAAFRLGAGGQELVTRGENFDRGRRTTGTAATRQALQKACVCAAWHATFVRTTRPAAHPRRACRYGVRARWARVPARYSTSLQRLQGKQRISARRHRRARHEARPGPGRSWPAKGSPGMAAQQCVIRAEL